MRGCAAAQLAAAAAAAESSSVQRSCVLCRLNIISCTRDVGGHSRTHRWRRSAGTIRRTSAEWKNINHQYAKRGGAVVAAHPHKNSSPIVVGARTCVSVERTHAHVRTRVFFVLFGDVDATM